MKIINTNFNNLFIINYDSFIDERGEFVKTYNLEFFKEKKLNYMFEEQYFSISKKNVFRGLHFQNTPYEHDKIVRVVNGEIIDYVFDLRSSSKTFGQYFKIHLNDKEKNGLYIGKGFAHGFLSLTNECIVEYLTSRVQNKDSESGININSINILDLPIDHKKLIISNRDLALKSFDYKKNYFK